MKVDLVKGTVVVEVGMKIDAVEVDTVVGTVAVEEGTDMMTTLPTTLPTTPMTTLPTTHNVRDTAPHVVPYM